MSRLIRFTVFLLLLGAGGWFAWQNVHIDGLEQVRFGWKSPGASGGAQLPGNRDTIRVASFNIQVFGQTKSGKPEVMDVLARVVRRFDIVAVQEIRSKQNDVLPRFVELINATGRRYNYRISRRLGRTVSTEQYAFIYDTDRVEADPDSFYTVGDPADLLHREPHVGSFRVRGPPVEQAFTFTLINIHTDPDEVKSELPALAAAYRVVRDQEPIEDDVIVLGDLNTDAEHLGELGQLPYMRAAIVERPTNTAKTKQYDNILFHAQATTEFTGVVGVLDLEEEFGLTRKQALAVSDHLPVWAEFSAFEGGAAGVVAGRPKTSR